MLSRDSRLGQRNDRTLAVQVFDCLVNGPIEFSDASECLMSQIVRLRSCQTTSMSFSSGVYFGNHSTVSQCARAARAGRESLLMCANCLVV